MMNEKRSIWSAKQVKDIVKEQVGLEVSAFKVLNVLKNKMKLSYRRVKRVPFAGNSERNKALRNLYA